MRTILQRVNNAHIQCFISKEESATSSFFHSISEIAIDKGLVVYVCVERGDTTETSEWIAKKIINMRIFSDAQGNFNDSVLDVVGEILVVSNFTLAADTKKGNRPNFSTGISVEQAKVQYLEFLNILQFQFASAQKARAQKDTVHTKVDSKKIVAGVFGAYMKIVSEVDGPVNIILDSKNRLNN